MYHAPDVVGVGLVVGVAAVLVDFEEEWSVKGGARSLCVSVTGQREAQG